MLAVTAWDDFHWSGGFESHCETTKFSPCLTGGQVVAGSNPVSPTTVSPTSISAGESPFWALVQRTRATYLRSVPSKESLVNRLTWVRKPSNHSPSP